jgi:hypothetical protein
VTLSADGRLRIDCPVGAIEENAPDVYQDGRMVPGCSFAVRGQDVAFRIGEYDETKTLVIDPWATYLGGNNYDVGNCIRPDGSGNMLVTGITAATNFPVTNSTTLSGNYDGFLAKFSSTGFILWATYHGGTLREDVQGVAVDGNGKATITGWTASTNYPVTNFSVYAGGLRDAFVTQFDATGIRQWSMYYGGSGDDRAYGICTYGGGNLAITGYTESANFPVTMSSYVNSRDVFLVTFSSTGVVQMSRCIGGNSQDEGYAIAADPNGNLVMTGRAGIAANPSFPVTNSRAHAGFFDVFISRYSPGGVLLWATFYGGSDYEEGRGITTDASGNIFVTGYTKSVNFPVTDTSTIAGNEDIFIMEHTGIDTTLMWATMRGSSYQDRGEAVATDGSGNVIMAGWVDPSYPVTGTGGVILEKYNRSGSMLWALRYGGSLDDHVASIATNATGNVMIAGSTNSTNFPVTNSSTAIGGLDAFVMYLLPDGTFPIELSAFTASLNGNAAFLSWRTESETGNYGFEVQRFLTAREGDWDKIGFVPGAGTSVTPLEYSFVDEYPAAAHPEQSRFYRLKQIDMDGRVHYSGIVEAVLGRGPEGFAILDVHPQPAHGDVTVRLSGIGGEVTLRVINALGRTIREQRASGMTTMQLDLGSSPSGMYTLVAEQGAARAIRCIMLR